MSFALTALAGLLVLVVAVMWMRKTGAASVAGGVKDGRLAPCPDRPNCVSSQSDEEAHAVKPLKIPDLQPLERIKKVLSDEPRAQLVAEQDNYLHYVFKTQLWRFEDDVEFLHDGRANLVHLRSASRIGYSDLGANRKRVERIRARLQ